jgi:hypothetical protein
MLALDQFERPVAVGDEGEVLPGREQLLLSVEGAHAADDQVISAERRLGDLRLARHWVVGERLLRLLRDRLDRRGDRLGEADANRVPAALRPELGGDLLVPEAGIAAEQDFAGGTGAAHPRDQLVDEPLSAPRCVFAEPFRSRTCSVSSVPARVASSGW